MEKRFLRMNRIRNGGIYLVQLDGHVSPEFKYKHFCILFKTQIKNLYLSFPLTTSSKRKQEKYTIPCPNNTNASILLQQVCVLSEDRILDDKTDENGELVALSADQCAMVFNEYIKYLNDILENTSKSIAQYIENKNNSLGSLTFECPKKITIFQGEKIDYRSIPTKMNGGKIKIKNEISTQSLGDKEVEMIYEDKYYNSIKCTVLVHVVKREDYSTDV